MTTVSGVEAAPKTAVSGMSRRKASLPLSKREGLKQLKSRTVESLSPNVPPLLHFGRELGLILDREDSEGDEVDGDDGDDGDERSKDVFAIHLDKLREWYGTRAETDIEDGILEGRGHDHAVAVVAKFHREISQASLAACPSCKTTEWGDNIRDCVEGWRRDVDCYLERIKLDDDGDDCNEEDAGEGCEGEAGEEEEITGKVKHGCYDHITCNKCRKRS